MILLSILPQGRHLTRGVRKVDYKVTVGDGICVVLTLTDNQIECRLPAVRPKKRGKDNFCEADTKSLQVRCYFIHLFIFEAHDNTYISADHDLTNIFLNCKITKKSVDELQLDVVAASICQSIIYVELNYSNLT